MFRQGSIFHQSSIYSLVYWFTATHECDKVWTGAWNPQPGDEEQFVWLFTEDPEGPQEPMPYRKWAKGEPDNRGGAQHTIQLHDKKDFDFGDRNKEYSSKDQCYVCEC